MLKKFYVRNILIFSLLILIYQANHEVKAQGYFDYNWYFGNSTEAIIFNKFNTNPELVDDQAIPFGIGGSAVATNDNRPNETSHLRGRFSPQAAATGRKPGETQALGSGRDIREFPAHTHFSQRQPKLRVPDSTHH